MAGVCQGGVTARVGCSREKGRTCRDAQPKDRHQTGSHMEKGRIQVTAHLAGDSQGWAVMCSWDTSVVLQVCLELHPRARATGVWHFPR